jgi:hypothetical protein
MRRTFKIIAFLSISFLFHMSIPVTSLFASPRFRFVREPANLSQGRNQQSLPPEKQKSLATYGPEDVFPAQPDERNAQKRNKRAAARSTSAAKTRVKPVAIIVPTPTPPAQITNATVDPSPSPSPSPSTSATPAIAAANLIQEDTSQRSNTLMSLQNLLFLAVLVSSALIFVLFKLMSKLREGSG